MSEEGEEVRSWWGTSIVDMEPGRIVFRGHRIEDLIGKVSLTEMLWLMLRGDLPTRDEVLLLECALVAGVDHGPQAPSIAAARMAATCGVGLNNVMATGINMLGDVHGGAGEQCAELYMAIKGYMEEGMGLEEGVERGVLWWKARYGRIVSGFGHRFHKPVDPRAPCLLEKVRSAAKQGVVTGEFASIGEAVEAYIGKERGKKIGMNIDGATAVIFCELGFPPPLSRGLFCFSRSVGILAHGWEQMEEGVRNKGPMPPAFLPKYKGGK